MSGNTRPPRGEGIYNVVVIGAGTAGLVTAAGTSGLGGRVALVERDRMGGDCLNSGCVPSKALIKSGRVAATMRHADRYGLEPHHPSVDYGRVVRRMKEARARIAPNDSAERFESLGVDVFKGEARFESPHAVRVGDTLLRARHAVIATGSRAAVPPIPGLAEAGYFTNENFFENEVFPPRLAVIGAGPIGCELAQALSRFGSRVTILEMVDQVLPNEDADVAAILEAGLRGEGIDLRLKAQVKRVEPGPAGTRRVIVAADGKEEAVEVDAILVATGRRPNVDGLDLDKAGVRSSKKGVEVDRHLRTTNPDIYAAGDVVGSYQFTHFADYHARIVVRNILLPGVLGFLHGRAEDFVLPWTTFTEPEVARVGLGEKDAKAKGIPVDIYRFGFSELDRAILDAADVGFVKVLTARGKDRILGAAVAGEGAGELIHEFVIAIKNGVGLGSLSSTIHAYPTLSQAVQRVGDAYQRTRLTDRARKIFNWLYTRQRRAAGLAR